MTPIFTRIQQLEDEGKTAAVCTVIETSGSTPRKPGARMIVYPDGSIEGTVGGGALEKSVIEESLKVIETGEAKVAPITLREHEPDSVGGVCGGALKVFIERVGTRPRLLILGAGHVGQTLARMARELDLQVVVFDDREDQASPDRFPPDVKAVCGPFEKAMEILKPAPGDYIAIMTYKFTLDEEVLHASLQTPARYIGMIGSDLKCMRVMNDLEDRGVAKEQLERVRAPIGIDIGAHTPAEVAVSILAQIVKIMNGMET